MKQGDVTTQPQSVILPGVSFKAFNRNLADATNTVIYDSIGFTPSFIKFSGNINNTDTMAFGATDLVNRSQFYIGSSGWNRSIGGGSDCLICFISAGNSVQGNVDSFDVDGFTITWTKTGSPTGTMNWSAECFQ